MLTFQHSTETQNVDEVKSHWKSCVHESPLKSEQASPMNFLLFLRVIFHILHIHTYIERELSAFLEDYINPPTSSVKSKKKSW